MKRNLFNVHGIEFDDRISLEDILCIILYCNENNFTTKYA